MWARATGISRFASPRVGPSGKVFAQDLDEAGLKRIADRAQLEKIAQIETIRGAPDDPGLKESSLDAILVVDVFHEFTHSDAMLAGFYRALRSGGRLAPPSPMSMEPST